MIKYEVITTEQAECDLRGIFEYIAFELIAPGNAAGQLDRCPGETDLISTVPRCFYRTI